MSEIAAIREAVLGGAGAEVGALPLPEAYRGAVVRADEQEMFAGLSSEEKDPRKSIHLDEVPLPELAPDEAYVAVMASSINFNTVWTSIFEPLPTFPFLDRLGEESVWGARHAQPYHVMGSDASGVVLRVGSAVRNWKPGDAVTVHCNHVDDQDPSAHDDSMLGTNQRIWGYETNFGGLGEISVVKANQLMPKPAHLTWEEAAVNALTNSTSYRMLVSPNGAQMTQGQTVLIWGASGGIGAYACQYVLNGGGVPVAVVSSPERVALLHDMGVEHVIDRKAEGYRFWSDAHDAGPVGMAPAREEDPRAHGHGSRHRVRAPGAQHDGRVRVRVHPRRHHRDVRRHDRLHDRVRQPLSLDEPEDVEGLPLRELPRGVGGEPPRVRGEDPSDAVGGLHVRADGRSGVAGAPQPARRQARCARARAGRGPRRHRRRHA